MKSSIADLWSDNIRADVLTPAAILEAQVEPLRRKTKGVLRAELMTSCRDGWVEHQLQLVAPALQNYRVMVLTVRHLERDVYPTTVMAPCFQRQFRDPLEEHGYELGIATGGLPRNQRPATNQDEFMNVVRQVLQSNDVRATIESLIAQSNEREL